MGVYFQKKPVTAQRPKLPFYYGQLISFNDLEYALENGFKSGSPTEPIQYGVDWKLAKRVMKDGEYWTGLFQHNSSTLPVAAAIQAVMKHSYTLILNRAQSVLPNVNQAAWAIEDALGWAVSVNIYVTPPGGSQGFEAHIDWMDGFILQTAGMKQWKTYEPALVEYPRPDLMQRPPSHFLSRRKSTSEFLAAEQEVDFLLPPPAEFTLKAGDMLYVPRGVVHEAATQLEEDPGTAEEEDTPRDEEGTDPYRLPSMHLTFGMEVAKGYTVEVNMLAT
jgi:hypothetical protein